MQNIKKFIAAAVAAAMLICVIPIQIFADSSNGFEELNDGYISVKVSEKNGGFLIDTVEGDKLNKSDNNKFLLYPSEDFDTSYTTFRVTRGGDVKDYIFGRSYGFMGLAGSNVTLSKNSDSISAKWSVDGLEFTQTMTLQNTKSALHGMVQISYSVRSTDGKNADNVKARIMLDTALGYQDYAVYELTQADGSYNQIQQEAVIDNSDGNAYNNALFGYDDPKAPSITAYTVNASVGDTIVKPYRLAFGHWNNLAATVFDFTPDTSLTFTNQYNEKYLTADSAYALYFDMGAASETASTVSTNYGVYSNAQVNNADKVSINFSSELGAMQLNAAKDAYISQVSGGKDGDFTVSAQVKNISGSNLSQIAVAIYPQEGITPYNLSSGLEETASYSNPYSIEILDFNAGEERQINFKLNAVPLSSTDYRKIELRCFDVSGTDTKLLSEKQIGTRSTYLLCPGASGDRVSFVSLNPEVIYNKGTRHIYLAGQNFKLLKNTAEYDIKLVPADGGRTLTVPSNNFILDADKNTADLILDEEMSVGTYQIVFDMKDTSKRDVTSDALRFSVSDDIAYQGGSYGVVTIEKAGTDKDGHTDKYALKTYRDENDYKKKCNDPQNVVLLEFRGDFNLKYEGGKLVEAEAVSLETVDRKAKSTINISDCLDVEKGTVTISVENPDTDEQVINVDIDGEVYTTGARTKVWSGVCAISSFENGSESTLLQYTNEGKPTDNVENSVANTNGITLIWPGAASTAQTIAGMIMEFRYCQFGQMALEDGTVTSKTPKQRIIAFGAQLSPDFLVPSNFKWRERKTSAMEVAQLKLAKSNYTPEQLRDVQDRYAEDQEAWEEAESGNLSLYIHDILFGSGFIGFNTSVEVGIPSYADGLPSIEGTLNLKVMNKEYTIGVEGTADMLAFQMEAAITLRSHNGIPIPDKLYFYAGGFTPGINVDGFGIFWIKGAGGGIDNLYETIYPSSSVPPITLLLSGQFALFDVLSARGDLSISPRAFSIGLSDVEIAGISLLNYAGINCQWYPELKFAAAVYLDILDAIEGKGSIIVEKDQQTGKYFWEGFATASVSIPDKIPIFGGKEIGSADLGINAQKIWGAIHVLKIDAGVTYYWGGDVDFAFGKYDAPEATIEPFSMRSLKAVPVYIDDSTGKTLYMSVNNGIRTLAANNQPILRVSNGASVKSQAGKKTHTVNFGRYDNENGILTVVFDAPDEASAKYYANNVKIAGYPLTMLIPELKADDPKNTNANASFNWDKDSKQGTLTVTVTDCNYFNQNLTVTTPVTSTLTLYGIAKLPTLDTLTFDGTSKVTWSGDLDKFSELAIYATDANGEAYPLYKTSAKTAINGGNASIRIPENMQSGTYTIRAVAKTADESSNPIIDAAEKLLYTNSKQPTKPEFSASLGGDYSIDLNVTNAAKYDGFKATVYEIADGKATPTIFNNVDASADENGIITVGGQYSKTVYTDENGKEISYNYYERLSEDEKAKITQKSEILGLSADKQYKIGLIGYKKSETSDIQILSEETLSAPLTMTAPKKANITLNANGSQFIDETDTVNSSDVSISFTSDMPVSGTWNLDNGEQSGSLNQATAETITLKGLTDGSHTITFKGENNSGDGTTEKYIFTVDTLAPRLQISSPSNGGFFDSSVTVKGISDSGATVYIRAEGKEPQAVNITNSQEFEKSITLDSSKAYQNIMIYAKDKIGNETAPITLSLTNSALGNPNASLAVFLNGADHSQKKIDAGSGGQLSLKLKQGDKYIDINDDSAAANRVDWNVSTVSGSAEISDSNSLTSSQKVNGFIVASLDGENAYAVLGGTNNDSGDEPTPPPAPTPDEGSNTSGGSGSSGGSNITYKPPTSNPFTDVSLDDWFYDYVMYAYQNGLMKGTDTNIFEPDFDVTRAMFVTILYRLENEPTAGISAFTDVQAGNWYSKAVAWANKNGIVNGVTDTEFAPNDNITREQMAAIIYRYLTFKGHDTSVYGKPNFTDTDDISEYALDAVMWLRDRKIILGEDNGGFAPKNNATRAQAAAIFERISENL